MITVDIIGRHCCSCLSLVGIGIREAQVGSVVNGIVLIPNGLRPQNGRMKIPLISISFATPTFILSSSTSCRLILLPIGGFVVNVVLVLVVVFQVFL